MTKAQKCDIGGQKSGVFCSCIFHQLNFKERRCVLQGECRAFNCANVTRYQSRGKQTKPPLDWCFQLHTKTQTLIPPWEVRTGFECAMYEVVVEEKTNEKQTARMQWIWKQHGLARRDQDGASSMEDNRNPLHFQTILMQDITHAANVEPPQWHSVAIARSHSSCAWQNVESVERRRCSSNKLTPTSQTRGSLRKNEAKAVREDAHKYQKNHPYSSPSLHLVSTTIEYFLKKEGSKGNMINRETVAVTLQRNHTRRFRPQNKLETDEIATRRRERSAEQKWKL